MSTNTMPTDEELFGASARPERGDLPENPFPKVAWQHDDENDNTIYHKGQVVDGFVVWEVANLPATKIDRKTKQRVPDLHPEGHKKAGQQKEYDLLYIVDAETDEIRRLYVQGYSRKLMHDAKSAAELDPFNTQYGMRVRWELTGLSTPESGEGKQYDFDVKVRAADPATKVKVITAMRKVRTFIEAFDAAMEANKANESGATAGKLDALTANAEQSKPDGW